MWPMRLLQKDPAGSGKRMDCSQGLVNNKTDSNDADMRSYFILFQSQNAFMLFGPNVVLMLLVLPNWGPDHLLVLSEQLQMANKFEHYSLSVES